ncbi:MAG: extracellular solute-binding protein [Treponema sp.]|jgi:raffinose/stachyose/melibiose transport system substrate-binding protein|nr:extracellular solute-binding protein [Treponema sp.]
MKKAGLWVMVCLAALAAAGCGKKDAGDGPVKITLWHQSVGETDPSGPILKKLVAQWNQEHPEYQVEEDGVTGEQYKTKIKTALSADDAPDIMYMYGGSFMMPYLKAGKFLELGSLVPKGTLDRILPGSLAQITQSGGKIYTLPCYTHIASLYCNKELFDKAGAKLPENYTELLEAARKLRAAGITPAVISVKDRWPAMYWYDIIAMRQAGIPASLEAMKNPSLFTAADFTEAGRKLVELVDVEFFNSSMFSMSFDEMLGAFNNGQAAMLYQGNWVNSGIENAPATQGKVTVIPFPVFEDGKGLASDIYGGDSSGGYYVNAQIKNPALAAEFMVFFNENMCRMGFLAGAGLPCWNLGNADTSSISGLDKEVAASMDTAKAFIPWWDNILPADSSETHKDLIAQLMAKEITPREFGQRMAQVAPSDL